MYVILTSWAMYLYLTHWTMYVNLTNYAVYVNLRNWAMYVRVYGADGAVHGTIRTVHTTYAAALKTTTHPKLGAENHMLQLNV